MPMKRSTLAVLFVFGLAMLPVQSAETANPFSPPNFPLPKFKDAKFNVKDFDATGNGLTNDTPAINQAIEKCSAGGGGDVVFPAGKYAAASIHLKSNVRLVLDPDAVITEVDDDDGYQKQAPIGIRFAQALHHGTDHRSQICTAITTLGVEPPGIDVWDFGLDDGRVVEVPPKT